MFLNDLFTIQTERRDGNRAEFSIRLNAAHPIYSGHFPGDPITPGVCVVQIATDLFAHLMQQEFTLTKAKNIKFLNLIKPAAHPEICYKLDWEAADEEETYKIKAVVCTEEVVFSKISFTVRKR